MALKPTSIRLPDEYLDLLDAWAEHLSKGRMRRAYRVDVLYLALKRLKPPVEPGETEAAVRAAYTKAFDGDQP